MSTTGALRDPMTLTARRRSHGFSLAELAIVVVIIGLLLATISQVGPRLIDQSRDKELLKQVSDIRSAIIQFQERFRFLPGDMPATTNDFATISPACITGGAGAGDGNGLISATEATCVGEHLFQAGLIANAQLTVQNGSSIQLLSLSAAQAAYTTATGGAVVNALPARIRNVVLVGNVPCGRALAVDHGLDDGNLTTGSNVVAFSAACTGVTSVWIAVAVQ